MNTENDIMSLKKLKEIDPPQLRYKDVIAEDLKQKKRIKLTVGKSRLRITLNRDGRAEYIKTRKTE